MIKNILLSLSVLDKNDRKKIIYLFFFLIIAFFLEMFGIGAFIPLLSTFSEIMFNNQEMNKNTHSNNFLSYLGISNFSIDLLIMIIIVIFFVKNILLGFIIWFQNKFIFELQAKISNRLFESYLFMPWHKHLNINSSILIRNILHEAKIFSNNFVGQLIALSSELILVSAIIIILIFFQPLSTISIATFLIIILTIYFNFAKFFIKKWSILRQKFDGEKIKFLNEGLGVIKDLKILGREISFYNFFSNTNNLSANISHKQATLSQLPRLWLEFLAVFIVAISLIFLVNYNNNLSEIFTIIGIYIIAIIRLLPSSNKILSSLKSIKFSLPSINVITNELNYKFKNKIYNKNKVKLSLNHQIKFENVSFEYDSTRKSGVKNINIQINKNSTVGIIGENGSGKSTLIDLLIGLNIPKKGKILVDQINIHDHIRDWQNNIGYVPQDIYLVDDTLKNNICLGIADNDVNYEKLAKCLKVSNLENFINNLPKKLDTVVGEKGIQISGGQLQRVGIARALYNDPEILVFDEATSSLDLNTEKNILNEIKKIKNKKTIIIITHRDASLKYCDVVYNLKNGFIENEKFNKF